MKRTINFGISINSAVEQSNRLKQVYKNDLDVGDCLLIVTQNSEYLLKVIDKNLYEISGGWFEKRGLSPSRLNVVGCTWGGSMVKMDIVAACGLCLEFGNRVVTSRIQKIVFFKIKSLN